MTNFEGLKLAQPILRAVANQGYTTPSPIQAQTIPSMLDGRDILGVAQTGTGKTAAFALPILHQLAAKAGRPKRNAPRALVLAPTRELAGQIGESFRTYGKQLKLFSAVAFGGVSINHQIRSLDRGVHILIATPGRLIDLMNQGHVSLDAVDFFVLDEADRMLDMGFIPDVKKISAALPEIRQTALFSATMPKTIQGLAESLLDNPVKVEVAPAATTAEKVEQSVLFVAKDKKRSLLSDLMADDAIKRVLIFTRTKHGADRVARHLIKIGVKSDAIHGDKTQNARQRALKGFKNGKIRALVATDIAARGIDVDGVTHVINYELPNEAESYVHRIGRTARGGDAGIALSFCDHSEYGYLQDIEKTIRQQVPLIDDHAWHVPDLIENAVQPPKRGQRAKAPSNNKQPRKNRPGSRARKRHQGQGKKKAA